MMRLDYSTDMDRIVQAMRKAPRVMGKHLRHGMDRAALELSRSARRKAPKATSQLVNSIGIERPGQFSRVIAPASEHGAYQELGTGIYGPGGIPSGKMPPMQSLRDWIRTAGIEPRDPSMDTDDLAFVIGRSIAEKGTHAQPFMKPAFEEGQDRAFEVIRRSAEDGLREVAAL